jgi:hypothetical protein
MVSTQHLGLLCQLASVVTLATLASCAQHLLWVLLFMACVLGSCLLGWPGP